MYSKPRLPEFRVSPSPDIDFPEVWCRFIDDTLPQWVKNRYSPNPRWKDKPFSMEDVKFFIPSIRNLSDLFTRQLGRSPGAYFQQARFRSAYLLYFLPLQASKFISLFCQHPEALRAALAHGRETNVLRIADLGSGPATASLAFLAWLAEIPEAAGKSENAKGIPPKIVFHLYDRDKAILQDGKDLLLEMAQAIPKLKNRVEVITRVSDWREASRNLPDEISIAFFGHVLNETTERAGKHFTLENSSGGASLSGDAEETALSSLWTSVSKKVRGGGILIVEPATRQNSQHLCWLRDRFIKEGLIAPEATSLWGPCLHAGSCPLGQGRDWCHFSTPVQFPGKWFRAFSRGLATEREWVKYTYLWLASPDYPSPAPDPSLRRVVSDPLGDGRDEVLLCEPAAAHAPRRLHVMSKLLRGSIIEMIEREAPKPQNPTRPQRSEGRPQKPLRKILPVTKRKISKK